MQIFSRKLLMATDDLHGSLEFTTVGIHSFKLSRRTKANIVIVGAGQYSTKSRSTATGTFYYSGSGGAAFAGGVILPAGAYTVYIGNSFRGSEYLEFNGDWKVYTSDGIGENSYLRNSSGILITAGGTSYGQHAVTNSNGSQLAISANLEIQHGTVTLERSGNYSFASGGTGGASLYNGYGKGSDGYNSGNSTKGYFKIEW